MRMRGGERLMVSFEGSRASSAIEVLEATGASALILLSRNLEDARQTHALLAEVRTAIDRPLLVAIDQEGGTVVRIREGVTVFPGNSALAACGSLVLAEQQGLHCARQLSALGIDMNLAPVVDLGTEIPSPSVGQRVFSTKSDTVFRFAMAILRGQQQGGIASCLKHFPGLGTATIDPHLALAARDLQGGVEQDPQLGLFRRLLAATRGVMETGVMSTHLLVEELDAGQPATLSRAISTDLLRGRFGFGGLLVADDMEMGAMEGLGGPGEIALAAVQAGHDLLPFCHSQDKAVAAARALDRALRCGELPAGEHLASVARIRAFAGRAKGFGPIDPGPGDQVAQRIRAGASAS